MNSAHTLTFLWTPWSVALSIAVVILAAGFCWAGWRRSGYARSQGLLELLRLTIVVLLALILNQPEWVEEFQPVEKPAIAVLWDNSASMETRDVPLSPSSGAVMASRREAITANPPFVHDVRPTGNRPLLRNGDCASRWALS